MAMVQPPDTAVKASQILARFRPIAPRPAAPPQALASHVPGVQARKRGRPSITPATAKRQRNVLYSSLRFVVVPNSIGFCLASPSPASESDVESSSPSPEAAERGIPVERDLLIKLQETKIIAPLPVRPVSSSIHIESIRSTNTTSVAVAKTMDDVAAEVESDVLPAVVSDSRNRVRLVNEAYKAVVGQPECRWLDSVVAAAAKPGAAESRRINGEVALDAPELTPMAVSREGFSCTAKIEWSCNGRRTAIRTPCVVSRLHCESGDYLFAWRFQTSVN